MGLGICPPNIPGVELELSIKNMLLKLRVKQTLTADQKYRSL